jgi:hypothetical protein
LHLPLSYHKSGTENAQISYRADASHSAVFVYNIYILNAGVDGLQFPADAHDLNLKGKGKRNVDQE